MVLTFEAVDEILRCEYRIQIKPLLNLSASERIICFSVFKRVKFGNFANFNFEHNLEVKVSRTGNFPCNFFAYATLMSHIVYEVESSLTLAKFTFYVRLSQDNVTTALLF